MGVLARLFRRSKATEETAGTAADDLTTDATAEETAATTPESAEAVDTTNAGESSAGAPADDAGAERTGEPTAASARDEAGDGNAVEPRTDGSTQAGPVAPAAVDGVEIPRQQSAEEAADSGAGDGARA
ncbi:hypothetical protein [Streptomyces asoensis]|uniref:hypothetical protein n=1 Tax=Streptomyces asoensis TaxID=249586 RepID=UPI0033D3C211